MTSKTGKVEVLYLGDNIDSLTIMHAGYDFFLNNQLVREAYLEDALKMNQAFSVRRLWGTTVDTDFPASSEEL
jgi:hypothetical protein